MSEARGIKYVSLHEASGYGESARRYLRALDRGPRPLTWEPMVAGPAWGLGYQPLVGPLPADDDGLLDAELRRLHGRKTDYDTVIVHTVPEYFPLWRAREPGKRIVGYTAWETDRPPDHWLPLLNGVDLLLVPCAWNREVFRRHGVTTRIEVVPHIVHPWPYAGPAPELPWTCYSIGPWTARKAHWNAIEAYARAFTADDPVRLVIKTSEHDYTRPRRLRRWFRSAAAARRLLRRHCRPPPVEVIDTELSNARIDALHARGHCYVALGHGEGWNLPAFDAAAHGRPVVTTRFGGPLEFLHEDDAYLIDAELAPVSDRRGRGSYAASQRWAVPDLETAARALREAYEQRAEASARGARAAQRVRREFAAGTIAERLLAIL
jgi:glycosyltransferase involved in cell wall biosynthesis